MADQEGEKDTNVRTTKRQRIDAVAASSNVQSEAGNDGEILRDCQDSAPQPTTTSSSSSNPLTRDDLVKNIGIFDNILTHDQCQELIAIHNSHRHAGYIHHLTITRFSDLASPGMVSSLAMALPLVHARYVCWQTVEDHFGAHLELYPEFTALMAWHTGSFLKKHFDANREYLQDRHYSAVLYLNDPYENGGDGINGELAGKLGRQQVMGTDMTGWEGQNSFRGGDLVFEFPTKDATYGSTTDEHDTNDEFRVQPKAGRLVCFPSTEEYLHRVDEIMHGTRYTVTLWFTRHEEAIETLASLQQQLPWVLSKQVDDNIPKDLIQTLLQAPNDHTKAEQPWETPEQARQLLHKTMSQAALIWNDDSKRWELPRNILTNDGKRERAVKSNDDKRIAMAQAILSQTSLLLQLIAFCWWQRGVPVGKLERDELLALVDNWLHYIKDRWGELRLSARRWMEYGMITNAR
jgi:2OG-Fe(II) oxygenase superfamily